MTNKVWFITGASKGFGRILVNKLLKRGDKVAATSRSIESFADIKDSNFLALEVKNLADEQTVKQAVEKTIETFGAINILVNNAGYGLLGAFEEISDAEMRTEFDVNVFGTFNTIRNILPFMRKQKSGQIINISSIAGFVGYENWTAYNASKFAVVGFSDSLKHELKPLNIRVLCVMPGPFNTDFLNNNSLKVSDQRISDYKTNAVHSAWDEMNHKQEGDPDKAMDALIKLVDENNINIDQAFFGKWAYQGAKEQIKNIENQMNEISSLVEHLEYN
ncbi:SDR family oxidoreductase [Spiroplasma platyhelix]|uniref:SDR family oxidoreductase n=1 Tax=Spiroplasma platyhelix PALS-1 TaxID=1276218 RepID=A0A846U199_9MOLU|nr:SDR family oxidoreductase [Spiroplasma platyhelix]MBE4704412.1 3-phenylpropionate-dihydrodiol/cinnamic acid-dihydrodiol dehydrogenase [Spiroplasma platyhelix PALS-1]NKE38784.1 SDR family oxidoreductase [Spiroplasma platyhelix PALS-1]UJB28995.1 short-chain dehydrogenase [Spiroplasma platyhelix PALS-1]